ncbi:MAG: carboxypeptidase-like regulatory domain-containing protein [Planctomycetaceae bacterium]|jgi:hypothetical protein|nr:carboxypeptidase-like regulatory domain-containing protein [Planctomycetaceae bacterium]
MKRFQRLSFVLLSVLSGLIVSGCGNGGRPADLPKTTPCALTIQYEDGAPISDAIVMLYPIEGKWYSNGKTNSSGQVKVAVNGSFSGAVPGEYKVTVKKQDVQFPPGYDPDSENPKQTEATITDYVSKEFVSPATTPLKLTVGNSKISETFQVKKTKK